jgi:ATP-binding cassette subfamily B (MDR/TAP) protein 1
MSDLINLFISLVASVEIRNLLEIQNNDGLIEDFLKVVSRGNETEIGEFVVSHEELNKESLLKKLSDLSDQTKANDLNVATPFCYER